MEIKSQNLGELSNEKLKEKFESRALRLCKQANYILCLIVFILLLGAAVFLLAAQITSNDISISNISIKRHIKADSLIKEKQIEYGGIENKLADIKNTIAPEIKKINSLFHEKKRVLDNKKDKKARTCINTFVEPNSYNIAIEQNQVNNKFGKYAIKTGVSTIFFSTQKLADDCSSLLENEFRNLIEDITKERAERDAKIYSLNVQINPKIKTLKVKLVSLSEDINVLEDLMKESLPRNNSKEKDNEIFALIQINVTRFGSLLIVFFLVNILLLQYRYNMKLSVYYDARADALSLVGINLTTESLCNLFNVLTPDIDFGKVPQTPLNELIEVVKSMKAQKET
jgi:hypothetical protein